MNISSSEIKIHWFATHMHEEKDGWDASSFLRQRYCAFFFPTLHAPPKADTCRVFLIGLSHIPHTTQHVVSWSHVPVSSHSTLPFLFNSSLPPSPAKDLSLSPTGWQVTSHLSLPLLEPTHLEAMSLEFFFHISGKR